MSGETSLKFIIPGSLCQQGFTVSALFADREPKDILICDWLKKYQCNNAPGYNHTLENDHALITVPRDLKEKPEAFICKLFGQPQTDPSRCLCTITGNDPMIGSNIDISSTSTSENYRGTSQRFEIATNTNIIIPGQPGGLSPVQVILITGVIVFLVTALVFLAVVCVLIRKYYRRRTSSKSKHDPNGRPDERERLNEANKDAPKIFLTDSQKSSTATLICGSCGAVQLIKMLIEAKKDAPKISATDSQKSSTATVIVPPTETVTPKKKPIEANKDAPTISLTDSQKSSTATVICFSCGAVQLIKIPTSQTSEPSMDVPQMSAADLQESSTPAMTPPPTETVPPKKEIKSGRNKTHP